MTVHLVPAGTAEQLARLAHFAGLDLPEVEELDSVARFLIGNAGDTAARQELWQQLRDNAEHLWHLITDDWSDDMLDGLRSVDYERHQIDSYDREQELRYRFTRDRLSGSIENRIEQARFAAAAAVRAERAA